MIFLKLLSYLADTQIVINEPSWTDICQAIGAIATCGAFFVLFMKDKNKQEQLNRLAGIAGKIEAQNEILKESNQLLSAQLDLIRTSIQGTSTESKIAAEFADIEMRKLRLSVKPKLWLNGGMTQGHNGEMRINLSNKGERAYLKKFNLIEGEIALQNTWLPYELEKDGVVKIFAHATGRTNISDVKYEIEILYEDELKNKYRTIIGGVGANAKVLETIEE